MVDVAEGIASGVGGVLDFQVHAEDYAETAFSKDCATKPTRKRNGNEGCRKQIRPSLLLSKIVRKQKIVIGKFFDAL